MNNTAIGEAAEYEVINMIKEAHEEIKKSVYIQHIGQTAGCFDIITVSKDKIGLIQVKKTDRNFASMEAAAARFKDEIERIKKVPTPANTKKYIYIKGAGKWHIFLIR